MPDRLDLDGWPRRHHYEFFKSYELPFFSLCADVDVSRLYEQSRSDGGPHFFLASFYLALVAANEIEPFRYRLRGDHVVVHEVVAGGTTVLRRNRTFGFAYFEYDPSWARFETVGLEILRRARDATGPLEDRTERDDLLHFSVIPWVQFTAFGHARRLGTPDSIPKIVFGKHGDKEGSRKMPVSVEVHHALMDGLEVGEFFDRYQARLDDLTLLGT